MLRSGIYDVGKTHKHRKEDQKILVTIRHANVSDTAFFFSLQI